MAKVKAPGTTVPATIAPTRNSPLWGAGINLIWAPATGDSNPFVRSLQGIYRWKDAEPVKGQYDFRQLHADLKRAFDLNKPIMLQLNMPCPDWVAQHVSILGYSRGGYAPQFWDPTYISLHTAILKQFSAEIRSSQYAHFVIGVRVQVNGYNTEYFVFEPTEFDQGRVPTETDRSTWLSHPIGYSAGKPKFAPNRTDLYPGTSWDYGQQYMHTINEVYKAEFQAHYITCYWRSLMLGKHFGETYLDALMRLDYSGVLDTRCGWNLADGMPNRMRWFEKYCLQWGKPGYWEDSQYQFEGATWEQDIYWRGIARLYAGVTYVATYGLHIGYDYGFDFVNRYAGWNRFPATAPGAWVVYSSTRARAENFNMLMRHTNPSQSKSLTNINTEPEGLFARSSTIGFNNKLDDPFFQSIKGKQATLIITWYDNGATWQYGINKFGSNEKRFNTVLIPVTLHTADINIKVLTGTLILHKVEIKKV